MVLSVFSVPELAGCIAAYLTPRAIVNCMSTCQQMNHSLLQALWSDYFISSHSFHRLQMNKEALERYWTMAHDNDIATAIKKHRHLVRSIHLPFYAAAFLNHFVDSEHATLLDTTYQPTSCLLRLSLDVGAIRSDRRDIACPWKPVLTLLTNNPHLKELCLPADILMDAAVLGELATLLKTWLLNLQKLRFTTVHLISKPTIPLCAMETLLKAVLFRDQDAIADGQQRRPSSPSSVKEFCCEFQLGSRSETGIAPSLDWIHASKIQPSTSIQSLQLPSGVFYPLEFMAPLLEHCLPNLERFHIPWIAEADGPELGKLISKHCPKVAHLSWDPLPSSHDDQRLDVLRNVLRACEGNQAGGLKSVHLGYVENWKTRWYPPPSGIRLPKIMDLVLRHAKTLEKVFLQGIQDLSGRGLDDLLRTCPRLKIVSLPKTLHDEPGAQGVLLFETCMEDGILTEPVKTGWACTELKTLLLTLDRDVMNGDGDKYAKNYEWVHQPTLKGVDYEVPRYWRDEDTYEFEEVIFHRQLDWIVAKRVYAHIGFLTELEVLGLWYLTMTAEELDGDEEADKYRSMDPFQWDLTMQLGLPYLAGLKKLRHLHMGNDMWSAMGQKEMEFMVEHWPKLEKITFEVSQDEFEIDEFEINVLESSHWQWLMRQKPGLELLTREYYDF